MRSVPSRSPRSIASIRSSKRWDWFPPSDFLLFPSFLAFSRWITGGGRAFSMELMIHEAKCLYCNYILYRDQKSCLRCADHSRSSLPWDRVVRRPTIFCFSEMYAFFFFFLTSFAFVPALFLPLLSAPNFDQKIARSMFEQQNECIICVS